VLLTDFLFTLAFKRWQRFEKCFQLRCFLLNTLTPISILLRNDELYRNILLLSLTQESFHLSMQ
jgi:hypothetical protein